MEFILKFYQTEDLSSSPRYGGHFVRLWGATGSLPSGYHPQSNGQMERLNQDLESALRCLTERNPAYWSSFFQWMNVPTIHSPVLPQVSPHAWLLLDINLLFPSQEWELSVPSVQAHLCLCHLVWKAAGAALWQNAQRNRRLADRHDPPLPITRKSGCPPGTFDSLLYWSFRNRENH